ncbi:DUF397 domain-containing protein [Klebsiella pneumoniae]|nr:DUF397 domain-containing protein [Klebsiella pneumoniae]
MSDLVFQKSSYSANSQNCVEVAKAPHMAAVRDTQNREAGHLEFSASEFAALLHAVKTEAL